MPRSTDPVLRRAIWSLRFALYSLALLLASTALLVGVALSQLGDLSALESQARAQRISDGLAARVQQALALGIPLNRLAGVDALFEQRLAEHGELQSLRLTDASGQVRWQRQREAIATSGLVQVVSAVTVAGQAPLQVVAQVHAPSLWTVLAAWAWPLLGSVAALFAAATWAALPHRRWRRDALVAQAARQLAAADFVSRLPVGRRQAFDQRLSWLSAQWREVQESHRRVQRLVHSLRQTEPDAGRRELLDAALAEATGQARFAPDPVPSGAVNLPLPAGSTALPRLSLKTRITTLVLLTGVVLGTGFALVFWQRDQVLAQRYHASVGDAQSMAWMQAQSEAVHALQDAAQRLVSDAAWARAWRGQDKASLAALVESLLTAQTGWRVDVFDARRSQVYSSSIAVNQDALIDAGWLQASLNGSAPASGLSQVSRDRYFTVVVRRFDVDGRAGVLAVGLDTARLLPELGKRLGGDAFLFNLRGREVAGTGHASTLQAGLPLAVRQAQVSLWRGPEGEHLLASLQPLAGPDHRQVAALLLLRDISSERLADLRLAGLLVAGGVLFLLALGGLVFLYLRHALSPLERSVGVLGALSRGDLRAAPDDTDETLANEAGQIARGVATLRGEMLNLQMLRDERIRTRQQQEQLIRGELKQLAANLDEDARKEVLSALAQKGAHNELAELAHILGRLSGLVTRQQDRLVGLLKELRDAMAQQAQLISLQQELDIARKMQLSILPRVTPHTQAVQVAAVMVPAKEIGGDFYDYFMLDAEHLALVVADVSGKGVPAAFFMAISRTLLKANALFLREPARIISQLNDQLCAENEQMMFVTVFLGILNLRSGEMVFVNAGHNPPLLRRPDGQVTALPHGQNMALAVMDGVPYVEGRMTLAADDTLVLYTDGVTEATDVQGNLLGEAALTAVVRAHQGDNQRLPDAVLQAVRTFERGAPQADDITCVAVRYSGPH